MAVTETEVRTLIQDTGTPPILDSASYDLAISQGETLYGAAAFAAQMAASKFIGDADKQSLFQVGSIERDRYTKYMKLQRHFTQLNGGGVFAVGGPYADTGDACNTLPEGLEYDCSR